MRYLGLDVHSKRSDWTVVGDAGEVIAHGKVYTTVDGLGSLIDRWGPEDLLVGQEVGTMSMLVHDIFRSHGVEILSFNAHQFRMICSSRKKTDRRDSYWLARALQSRMYPHPVYIPSHDIRRLRSLLQQREGVVRERVRWVVRARSHLRMAGEGESGRARTVWRRLEELLSRPEGVPDHLAEILELSSRHIAELDRDEKRLEEELRKATEGVEEIERLRTIPGIGFLIAVTIYAWVGDVGRFRNARALCAYAGLVPSVRASSESVRLGSITKQGAPILRRMLVQGAQSLSNQCRRPEAEPLRRIKARIVRRSGRRKIGTVALARHLLRIAYYVLRDGTVYQPERLGSAREKKALAA